jgi:hypothetical protein
MALSFDTAFQNSGIYHNPKRQRGILGNAAERQKTQSLADASGWDGHKIATSQWDKAEGTTSTIAGRGSSEVVLPDVREPVFSMRDVTHMIVCNRLVCEAAVGIMRKTRYQQGRRDSVSARTLVSLLLEY